jgi:predicted ribosomally synthesized peptide with SipW-like signal peptide
VFAPLRALLGRLDRVSVRYLLSAGTVIGLSVTGTLAVWSDTVTVSGTTFSTGTIDLQVNNLDTIASYTTMNITNMVPGNSTAGVLTVKNNGTAPLKYTLDASASNGDTKGLGAALAVNVTTAATVTGTSPTATCAGTAVNTATTLVTGIIPAASARLLNPGATETLCIQATLPSNAASTLQNASTNVVLTFTGNSF